MMPMRSKAVIASRQKVWTSWYCSCRYVDQRGRRGSGACLCAFVALVAIVGSCFGAVAHADEWVEHPRIRLSFLEAPEAYACPSVDWFVAATEANLGRALGDPPDAEQQVELRIAIRFVRAEQGLTAHIEMFDREQASLGTRDVETTETSCTTLAEGLPLVLALLVDMHETDARVRLTPHRAPRSGEIWDFTLMLGGSFDYGWLPEPAFGTGLSLELGPSPVFRIAVRANVVLPQRSISSSGAGASVWGLSGALGVCSTPEVGPVELGGCLFAEGGWLEPAGIGLSRNRVGSAAHLALEPLLRGSLVTFEPLILTLEVGVGVPVVPQRFVYDDLGLDREYFVSAPVSFRARVLLGTRWR